MSDKFLRKIQDDITPINENLYCTLRIADYEYVDNELFLRLEGDIINKEIENNDSFLAEDETKQEDCYLFFYGFIIDKIPAKQFLEKSEYIFVNERYCKKGVIEKNVTEAGFALFQLGECICSNNHVDFIVDYVNKCLGNIKYKINFKNESNLIADVYFAYDKVFKTKKTYIDFEKPEKFAVYNINQNVQTKIPNECENKYKDKIPKSFYAYNVGQGNLEKLIFTDKSELLFDIGFTRFEDHSLLIFDEGKKAIENFDGDVIISHTDLDHILGVIYAPEKVFKEHYWIISQYKDMSLSAKRLIWYIYHYNKDKLILLNEKDNGVKINISDYLMLYKGNGIDINDSGLMLYVKNKYSVLFTGDCLYQFWNNELIKANIDYLLIPHHGCEIKEDKEIKEFVDNQNKPKDAIVSVGVNTYGHPNKEHLRLIREKYQTLWTINRDKPIKINL